MPKTKIFGTCLFALATIAIALTLPTIVAAQGKIAFTSDLAGNNDIWLMNPNGTGRVPLTAHPANDSYPDLSTDGSKIVFQSDRDGDLELYSMNAVGSFVTRLTFAAGQDTEPVFSPDGSKIVFASNRDGNFEIYIMNADGSGQTRLTTNTLDDGQAEFSPDGTKIIFSRLAANQSDSHIFTMDLTGANQVPLTSGSFELNGYASYSPDGTKIVFSRANLSHTNAEIYVMDANGANAVRLTTAAGQDLEAAFSPDGPKIVFRSERDGSAEIYVMEANGASQQRLTFDGAGTTSFAPSWSTVSLINVDISDELAAEQGATLTVPIIVSDTTGKGVISYDFTLQFDPSVLQLQDPAFEKAGTLSADFEINTGTGTPGDLVVSAFGTTPLSGGGTLLNLKFTVIGTPPTSSALLLDPFTFNEGIPFTEVSGGIVFVQGSVRGTVTYGTSQTTVGVPNVLLNGAGSPNVATTTASDGTYRLGGFGSGAYTVTPSKIGDVNGIAAFDASLVSQYLVGGANLSSNQQVAAEASGNGTISSFDAALIAQYVVGLPNTGNVGSWRFAPPSRSYIAVGSLIGEDYAAILIGEVSGNWSPTGGGAIASRSYLSKSEPLLGPSSRSGSTSVTLPSLKVRSRQTITIPVSIKFSRGSAAIQAYQFDLLFDPNVLVAESSPLETDATLSSGLATVSNVSTPGRLRVAVYGSRVVADSGTLINLRFRVVGSPGSASKLTWQSLLLNEGQPAVDTKGGSVIVRR